jgi:hypothetical protein
MSTSKLVTRDARGRVRPGSVLNPAGMKKGTRHNQTREMHRRLVSHADKAAQVFIEGLGSGEEQIRYASAMRIVDYVSKFGLEDVSEPLTDWLTERELKVFMRLMQRGVRRRDSGEPKAPRDVPPRQPWTGIPAPASEAVIDVAAEPDELVIDLEPTR